jgi:hypothetical protein
MKKFFFDLVDEVWDNGSYLIIKNKGEEDRIHYINIKDISYSIETSPNRVTISLRTPSKFGSEVSFSPQSSWIPFKKNRIIAELIDRIDKAKIG